MASAMTDADDFVIACPPGAVRRVLPTRARRGPAAGRRSGSTRYQVALQRALEVDGASWVSVTTLRGRTYLRAGIVNYLATRADIDTLIAALRRLSERVVEDLDDG